MPLPARLHNPDTTLMWLFNMTNHLQTTVEKVDESVGIRSNVSFDDGCLEDLHVQTASQEVRLGVEPAVLQSIAETGVAISVWQRGVRNDWQAWLTQLPSQTLPCCRLQVSLDEAIPALQAAFDASGMPLGQPRNDFVEDIAKLIEIFLTQAACDKVQLRLDVITDNACKKWHRDCTPLRMVCTYRGPGTMWVPSDFSRQTLEKSEDEVPWASTMKTGDVAFFKGCGWPGQAHEGGVVHRSPSITGQGIARLVLVLDAARESMTRSTS